LAFVVVIAMLMWMLMVFATTRTTALGLMMLVGFAMDQA
tara:strand:- start:379 stop:495 length:117 start_codon:yes stop_codon:yes gene_type:complete